MAATQRKPPRRVAVLYADILAEDARAMRFAAFQHIALRREEAAQH